MCGRYVRKKEGAVRLDVFDRLERRAAWRESFNVAPTMRVPVIRESGGIREMVEMRWGLVPSWAEAGRKLPMMHNARGETIAKLPSFRAALRSRRCLFPASGYYEWMAGTPKVPYYFESADGGLLAFAGIWENHAEFGDTVAIVTTTPNREAGVVHDRMPVILRSEAWARWLDVEPLGDGDRGELLQPAPDGTLIVRRVGPAVGNVRNDSEDLIKEAGRNDSPANAELF